MSSKNEFKLPAKMSWSQLPTPIHHLPRLSEECGVNLYVKRDDMTGFVTGGNKVRKLDFLFQEAKAQGATTVISCGGVQSNHCRAVAAIAAQIGLQCVLVLRGQEPEVFRSNLLLDRLLGAEILYVTDEQYRQKEEMRRLVESQVRARGGKPYYIPEGGSNALGSIGYVEAWREIQSQLGTKDPYFGGDLPQQFDSVVVANGSGGTQCGLILGKISSGNADTRVVGVNVCYDKQETFSLVKDILWNTISQFKLPYSFMADDIEVLDGFVGRGYALSTTEELKFLAMVGRREGLILDPVYSGKAFYGIWQTLKKDKNYFGKNILFIHTGGAFGNFRLEGEWNEALQ